MFAPYSLYHFNHHDRLKSKQYLQVFALLHVQPTLGDFTVSKPNIEHQTGGSDNV